MKESEREAFEASRHYLDLSTKVDTWTKETVYVHTDIQNLWVGWQASAKHKRLSSDVATAGGGSAAMVSIHHVTLKSRAVINKTIPRERQGWWADVCPGQRLVLRDATESDLARCFINKKVSVSPTDYYCELPATGSLVHKDAIAHCRTDSFEVAPNTTVPPSGNWRFDNGALYCGELRVARQDFDNNPNDRVIGGILEQIAAALNSPRTGACQDDTERLDFVLSHNAFLVPKKSDAGSITYQLLTQDEDENYITLSGENDWFSTPRAAVDAARAGAKGNDHA